MSHRLSGGVEDNFQRTPCAFMPAPAPPSLLLASWCQWPVGVHKVTLHSTEGASGCIVVAVNSGEAFNLLPALSVSLSLSLPCTADQETVIWRLLLSTQQRRQECLCTVPMHMICSTFTVYIRSGAVLSGFMESSSQLISRQVCQYNN